MMARNTIRIVGIVSINGSTESMRELEQPVQPHRHADGRAGDHRREEGSENPGKRNADVENKPTCPPDQEC